MDYNFTELIDIKTFQSFFDSFFKATGINCSILDIHGRVLFESGSRDICSKFYQSNPETLNICTNNKTCLVDKIKSGAEYACISCPNGLTSVGIPISINGDLYAVLYFGQFLLEAPSESFFRSIISTFGFDEAEYLKALESVSIIPKDRLNHIIKLLILICNIIGKLCLDALQEFQWDKRLKDNYQELESTYEELLATEEELRIQFTELQLSQDRLRESEERYRLALLGSHDGIWDWDIANNTYYYSDKWANMLGYTTDTLPLNNSSWRALIHPDDVVIYDREISAYINKASGKYKCEYRMRSNDGTYIWISDVGAATWNQDNFPIRMVGSHTDITDQKNTLEEVHRLAYYDSLTGFPNKYSLYQYLNQLCQSSDEFAVVFMDLDNFKSVNDILSHTFGDNLLKNLSFELSGFINESCSIYRWGGDEFVFVVKNIGTNIELSAFLDKLVGVLNSPFSVDDNELFVTASIGACLYPRDSQIPEELVKHSDTSMYQAKESGKNNYQIYSPDFYAKALEQLTLERELRQALKNNEFQVYYQPRMDIKTNNLVGMEALLRWVKSDGTIVSPLKFIPKAEETGLIVPIGEFVLREACRQLKAWEDKGYTNLTVSINLSPKQIEDKELLNAIKEILKDTQIHPCRIELEITESAAIKDMNQTIALLKELKQMGINVLLDDFGTGYSSLNFLRLLPVTTIKIDKSFIDKVEEDTTEKTIVKSLISLAHDIRMRVIAEGIETPSQLYFLKDHYCDEAQGFYFSKPIPAPDFERLLVNPSFKK